MKQSNAQRPRITIQDLVVWGKATVKPSATVLRQPLQSVWMDSRKITNGDVFLALKSERDDGHHYVTSALKAGACAAIVDYKRIAEYPVSVQKKCIGVKDTLRAVQRMATAYRCELDIPVVAITGSSGKTTTRQFITTILSAGFSVGATEGNLNNHIGVPLSVLKLEGNEDVAVFELGANHHREIHTLTRIVQPDVGIITNIGYAHIGYFGSRSGIADAKLEIVDGIPKKDGILLLNGDDTLLVRTCARKGYPAVFFGTSSRCAVRAENVRVARDGKPSFSVKGQEYTLSMPGRHFVYCALPAIFLARQLGIPDRTIAEVMLTLKPDPMRGGIVTKSDVQFILDCYNANPSSMKAGLSLLQDVARKKHSGAIVGDMLELGTHATRLHKQLGRQLVDAGVQKLVAVGEYASVVAEGARQRGMHTRNICCAPDAAQAVSCARSFFKSGDTVLIKGSRGMKLETVYQQL